MNTMDQRICQNMHTQWAIIKSKRFDKTKEVVHRQ